MDLLSLKFEFFLFFFLINLLLRGGIAALRVGVHPVFWWVKPDKENVFDKDIFFQDIYGIVKLVLETKAEIRKIL